MEDIEQVAADRLALCYCAGDKQKARGLAIAVIFLLLSVAKLIVTIWCLLKSADAIKRAAEAASAKVRAWIERVLRRNLARHNRTATSAEQISMTDEEIQQAVTAILQAGAMSTPAEIAEFRKRFESE